MTTLGNVDTVHYAAAAYIADALKTSQHRPILQH